jgi:transposase
MRFYTEHHKYYCGIDLHTKTMYICIIDTDGKILFHENALVNADMLLEIIKPYLPDIVISVECIFTWYWIADFCEERDIPFVLGHALYMKAIHGSKTKNDKLDSKKIAMLLRAGMMPMAYVYPRGLRSTRDLLRRRMHFTRKKAELLAHIQNTKSQYNLPGFAKSISYKANRKKVVSHFDDPSVQQMIACDISLIDHYDALLQQVELYILKHAKAHRPQDLFLLQTIPGVGEILSLVMLYEIHEISRFEKVQHFTSYSRLIKPTKESAGKIKGGGGKKMGNACLKWAFSEAVLLLIRESDAVKELHNHLKNRYGKARALAILSHKLGRTVFYMLKNKEAFDEKKFVNEKAKTKAKEKAVVNEKTKTAMPVELNV